MNLFTTNLSKQCYYGNVTNVLSYYGEQITEAELVLLSDALNCDFHFDKNVFLGISNEACEQGLKRIGYKIVEIPNDLLILRSLLENSTPILLLINSDALTHNNIFAGTNRQHYIVLLRDHEKTLEISDSFVQTIPMSVFQGETDANRIKNEIVSNRAKGVYIAKQGSQGNLQHMIKNKFLDYITKNASLEKGSVINNLKILCDTVANNIDAIFCKETISNLSYNVKVAGIIARFDYLEELLNNSFCSINLEVLGLLKSKWELMANRIMKCSITMKKNYLLNIFEKEIPDLIEKELNFYKELCENGGI